MRIANNAMAINTHRQYTTNNASVAAATEKLSSGYRINRAGDDAAGLAISEKMRAQIKGLNMASKNSQDAISLVQTAEGALTETHSILQRMRELSVQAASDTNDDSVDRAALDEEFKALRAEIDDIADKTAFNGKKLLNGAFAGTTTPGGSSTSHTPGAYNHTNAVGTSNGAATGFESLTPSDGATTFTITFGVSGAPGSDYTATLTDSVTSDSIVASANFAQDSSSVTLTFGTRSFTFDATSIDSDALSGDTITFTVTSSTTTTDPSTSGGMILQTGANTGDELSVTIGDMRANALELNTYSNGAITRAQAAGKNVGLLAAGTAIDLTTQTKASVAIESVNTAINDVSTQRAKLGAVQNRLQHKINNLDTSAENLQAAESRIRDLDMAKEMTNYTKNNILVQASTAMLAQANAAPQGVLQLLQ